ncbi:MAG TPA: NAD(P)/FAD-dependent oxidoreductase, partial [Actinotalea sp.]|nr:NAD(P)/FAD-dependent oxidoreductase [Actinotalea sp.]
RVPAAGALPAGPSGLGALIKAVAVPVIEAWPGDRAISTAGGIAWSEVDDSLMLRALPGTFVAGEMLDWEAPTGGYLLQASFSTGVAAARGALSWLGR